MKDKIVQYKEVMDIFKVKQSKAREMIKESNKLLEEKGYKTISGRTILSNIYNLYYGIKI